MTFIIKNLLDKYNIRISLNIKAFILIGSFVLFISAIIFASFWVSSLQKDFGLTINISGRQRMLTQKMTKEVIGVVRELEVEDKSRKIVSQLIATRNHLARTIARQESFDLNRHSSGFIPAKAGREISKRFTEGTSMTLKQTSLKIRNPINAPDAFEEKVLAMFEDNRSLEEYSEKVEEDGVIYFRYMKRLMVIKVCLKCHSSREKAPAYVRDNYPKDSAYGYKVGDIRGAVSIKTPLHGAIYDVKASLKKTRGLFDKTLKALLDGGETVGASGKMVTLSPTRNSEIIKILKDGLDLWNEFNANIEVLIKPGLSIDSEEFNGALTFVESENINLLKKMNAATGMYQKESDSLISRLKNIQIWALIITIVAALLSFWAIKKNVIDPMHVMGDSLNAVAKGDLTGEVHIRSHDEIGDMASTINEMTANLRKMIKDIRDASMRVAVVSGQISSSAEELGKGADSQTDSIEQTSTSIEEMNDSVLHIAENTSLLSESAGEASSSTMEISASIGEVAKLAEELFLNVDEVTSSMAAMSSYISDISSHVSELSRNASNTASSIAQIDASNREVEETVQISAKLSEATSLDADMGMKAVMETMAAMSTIKDSVDEAVKVISRLGDRSEDVGGMLNVINEVADRTNLLALNASIIAAQAGEEGKSFAVVADQIKSLATKTRTSTKEIEEVIIAVQNEVANAVTTVSLGGDSVNAGVECSERAGKALEKIIESASSSKQMVEMIMRATAEQLRGSQQVRESMEKTKDMLEKVNTAITEQERGSKYIVTAAESMKESSLRVQKATKEQSHGGELISKAIDEISGMVSAIAWATQEQAEETDGAVRTIEEIKGITKMNHHSVSQMKDMAENLVECSKTFQKSVDRFKT